VRYVAKKGVVLVGFHERKSRYIADMQTCKMLPPHVDAMLMPLRALIGMVARDTCPQIELACGDSVTALVLRHLEPCATPTRPAARFAAQHGVQWWLQPKGPDTVHLLDEGRAAGLWPAGLRHHHAVQAHRLHPGQSAHQPRAGGARCACWTRKSTSA
jgi:23S rRNA (uracil1939-C5)-methyltransferase